MVEHGVGKVKYVQPQMITHFMNRPTKKVVVQKSNNINKDFDSEYQENSLRNDKSGSLERNVVTA